MKNLRRILLAALTASIGAAASAAVTDIDTSPLDVGASSTAVKPNIMLLFDDSGSMAWDWMPDWIGPSPLPGCGVDKPRYNGGGHGGGGGCAVNGTYDTTGLQADPPYFTPAFNGIYYNPNVYYPPGVNYDGSTMTSYAAANSSNWTNVPVDAFGVVSGTMNLVSGYPEAIFCNSTSGSATCKRNGVDTGNPFLYNTGASGNGYPDDVIASGSGTVSVPLNGSTTVNVTMGTYKYASVRSGNPFYYGLIAVEFCSDSALTTCQMGTNSTYTNGASIRYCLSYTDAQSLTAVSGTTTVSWSSTAQPRCQKKYNSRLGYQYPRFGQFMRYDIVSTTLTYARTGGRTDCTAVSLGVTSCTYAQEMTNFANWYAYYHTRIQMAKTAVGLSFNTLTSSYRIGYITINAYAGHGGTLNTNMFLPINDFTTTQKQSFYNSFYALNAANGTPLREALSRVGQYYAGLTSSSALDYGMITTTNPDPVQYSCQQNFTILTTDGYWNGNAGQDLNYNTIDYTSTTYGQQDNAPNASTTPGIYEQRVSSVYGPGGNYDGNLSNSTFNGLTYTSSGTLSDVAMYYYKTNLRPVGSTNFNSGVTVGISPGDVPSAQNVDMNTQQHMVTFTIGLGVDGYLTYDTSLSDPSHGSADFQSIVAGTVGACVWTPGNVCDWPQVPEGTAYNDDPAKDDDLWHAAMNGRGSYLSAKNPQSLLRGLSGDLAAIQAQVGASAASATSTPNITQTNNAIYSTTFESVYWTGELLAQTINISTGAVNSAITWTESVQLDTLVTGSNASNAIGDSRDILTESGGSLVQFTYATLDTTAQAWFANMCSVLSQCASLNSTDQAIVNSGTNLVNYLRGQGQGSGGYADGTHFRGRTVSNITNILGDLVDSRPAVISAPMREYADLPVAPGNQTYAAYAAANANRESVIYVGGNDGMLHAFDATTGNEIWAYVPRMLLSRLYALSDISYGTQHQFFVDGSPEVVDVLNPTTGLWRTVLVEGLNDGGRGYFALDVTVPTAPVFLWEFCSNSTVCTSVSDANLGLTFGNPVITKRAYDGKWVVLLTSGYNNVSPGDGNGHLYELDPFSGAILANVSMPTGQSAATMTATPIGLGMMSALANNPSTDNTSKFAYAADLEGDLWRFNLQTAPPTASLMATLKDSAGLVQSVTTRPELGIVNNYTMVYVGTGRLLGVTDLQNPSTLSPAGNWSYVGSIYGLIDNGNNLGNPRANTGIVVQTITSLSSVQRTISSNPVNVPTNIGWMADFPTTPIAGERVTVNPQLVLGVLVVSTNIPHPDACAAGGDSWLYQFNYMTGGSISSANGVVGTETVGAMTVGNVVVELPNGAVKIISTLSNGQKQTSGLNSTSTNATARRVGWRVVSQ